LAARYITDRFLPDKAVDLMDEAMSSLRLEIESEPEELTKIKEEIKKLEIELEAIKKEKKKKQRERAILRQIADLKEKQAEIESRFKTEKELIEKIKNLKKEIEVLRDEAERESARGNLQKVAEIKYGKIPQLQKELWQAEKKLKSIQKKKPLLKSEVGPEEVAKVVSRWTGIPVTKLLEEEAKKFGFSVYYPEKIYCTDNGAMIAAAAYYDFIKGKFSGLDLNAIPYLKIGEK